MNIVEICVKDRHFQGWKAQFIPKNQLKAPNVFAFSASNHCLFVYMAPDIAVFADYSGGVGLPSEIFPEKEFYFMVIWAMFCGLC